MDKKELVEDIRGWIQAADKRYPGHEKDKLTFNISYQQLRDILAATEQVPRVIIEINGGVCQSVKANQIISVDVLDHDNWSHTREGSEEDKMYKDIETEYEKLEHCVF